MCDSSVASTNSSQAPTANMSADEDPATWGVDEVVKFLCREAAGEWSTHLPSPDLGVLEESLKANDVTGRVFLDLSYDMVKDLGVGGIGKCQYVLEARNFLRQRSTECRAARQQPDLRLAVDLPDPAPALKEPQSPATAPKPARRVQPTPVVKAAPLSSEAQEPHQPSDSAAAALGDDSWLDSLLRKYPPEENDDEEIFPPLGESSSEIDSDTQQEIAEDEMSASSKLPQKLPFEELNAIVDDYIAQQEASFAASRLPKEEHKAFGIWLKGHDDPDIIKKHSTDLAHLEKRLRELRKAFIAAEHTSRGSLIKACASLDFTVSDICFKKWQLSVVKQIEAPKKVARPPRTSRAVNRNVDSDGNETLDSDLGSHPEYESGEELADETDQFEECDQSQDEHGPDDFSEADQFEDSEQSQDEHEVDIPSEAERGDVPSNEERKRPRSASRAGPFRDSSSPDRDLAHLMFEDEDYPHSVAKKRRLEKESPNQSDLNPPAIPLQGLLPDSDEPLPSNEEAPNVNMGETIPRPYSPSQTNLRELVDTSSQDDIEIDFAVDLFDDVYSMMWATIEQRCDLSLIIAKALTDLTQGRAKQLSRFLTEFVPCLYRDLTQDALQAMTKNESVLEGLEPEQSHLAMLLATLFLSWVNGTRVPDGAIPADQVNIAIATFMRDAPDEDEFAEFFGCLNTLVKAYIRWLTLPAHVLSKRKKPAMRRQRRNENRILAQMPLNQAQKEGQKRQEQQDKAKHALLGTRLIEGNDNLTQHPVSFKDPAIYLDAHIGKVVKHHQVLGIQFMFREIVDNQGPEGCLLAHTMGLGKTMQVISLLTTISIAGASQNPDIRDQIPENLRQSKTLILCPAALIDNWRNELAMWSPENHNLGKVHSIPGKTTLGPGTTRDDIIRTWKNQGGILLMSYNIFRNLAGEFKGKHPAQASAHETVKNWLLNSPSIVVADEAQMLRNHGSQIAATTSHFRTQKRIALTGTPISNGLKDYFWMVDWVAPKYLGSFTEFNDKFIKPIEGGSHTDSTHFERRQALQRQELLHRIISPKVQRMDMSALKTDLPPKYEFSIYFEMTNIQKAVYNLFVDVVKEGMADNVNSQLMSWLSLLQLCSNHPSIFKTQLQSRKTKSGLSKQPDPSVQPGLSGDDHNNFLAPSMPIDEQIVPSPVLSELDSLLDGVPNLLDPILSSRVAILNEILNHAIAVRDKVLIFSSSIPTLNYLSQFMDETGRKYCRIDGAITQADRSQMMKTFKDDPTVNVFLISTRAGGLGLNIQTANRVVIFDFMFNPTWEEQAIGRAYRIGQKKQVFVYRLVGAGTFEEKIYGMAIFKSQLALRLVDHKNVTREGSKSRDRFLVHCTQSSHDGGIDDLAMAKDPGMMGSLKVAECARYILEVKLRSNEIDPNDSLTSAERQTVEDELHLRRLRIRDSTASTMMPMAAENHLPQKAPQRLI
ncbi:SNF2 family helicase/ATPase [Penicillium paradoxum]|uniref:SNF2 family helicase/ATPase n=1 Tax=Penicillium paradoxum TaxID=176176 RepID=UPI002549C11A|nr:SNF2 family helicase/ATPase [Penicillium paradoxum]KAJ5795057.1 SNF2 family helicase/ATPase [Penicillium paradoxum]